MIRHDAHGYWLEEAGAVEPLPPLEGALDCDVLVVGGGYTGLWTAWHLSRLEPEARVALLESDLCGRGPSGRNGGFVNALWFSLASMRDRFGGEAAIAVARAAERSVAEVGRFCEEQGVDAWYHNGGYLQVSSAEADDGEWDQAVRACRELGWSEAVQPLSAAEVAEHCESPMFRGGALYPANASVQPARLARGLRDRVADAGVTVHERSRLVRLEVAPWGCLAETEAGRVRAGSCVLALGPGLGARGSPLRGRLTISSSHIALTEPVPDLLEEIGWTGGECISDSRHLVHYMRTTPDGRILFGWGGGKIACGARLGGRTELDAEVVGEVIGHLRRYFPGLEGRRITHAWGGPIDVGPSHLPTVASLPGGSAWAAFGYTGNGVGPSQMVGRTLAALALDRRDEYSRLALVDPGLSRVPTGLAGWLGGNAVREGVVRKEAAEAEGLSPHPLSRGLAAIPELIGIQIGR